MAMILNIQTSNSEEWYINYSVEVMVLDWVNDELNNYKRVMSDTRQVLNDLENTIRLSKRWQSFSRFTGQLGVQKTEQAGFDKAYGHIMTMTLQVKKRSAICSLEALMPEYDFDKDLS